MGQAPLWIGIDAGGTSTRLLAVDGKDHTWTAGDGATNPRIVGIERSSSVLASLIEQAKDHFHGIKRLSVCAGVAGAATGSMRRALADSVKLDLKVDVAVDLKVTDDATIAYEAAFEGAPGTLFVVGTGSMILARGRDGAFVRSGGWGYLLGDEGSGYSIGRAGLQAVSASIDAAEATRLTTRAAAELDVITRDQLLEKVYGSDYSMAAFARAVLHEADEGDDQSLQIVEHEIRKLVDRFVMLGNRTELDVPKVLKVSGGLSNSRRYMMTLAEVVHIHFPDWQITKSGKAPVEGALWMARNLESMNPRGRV